MDDEERLEGEEEMELDEASDGEDDDEEAIGIPVSPANSDQLFTGVPVTPGNVTILKPARMNVSEGQIKTINNEVFYPVTPEEPFDPLRYQKFPLPGGKPLSIRRGPGRPRKERPPGTSMRGMGPRRPFGRGSTRGKGLYSRGGIRRTKSKDDDTHSESQSPLRLGDEQNGEGESSGIDRSMPAPEEPPYVPEKWPGKVCAFCNLGERSQLGQGELLQISCPVGFTPEKNANREESSDILMDVSSTGDKSPRGVGPGAVTCRRQKSLAKCRNPSLTNFSEPIEELTIVGYSEEPDVTLLFETTGQYYVHKSCAIWSSNSKDIITESISPAIVQASSRRCAYCSHYGAGIPCKVGSCNRYFHLPCAAASSCFQDTKTISLFCSQHLGQVPLLLNGDITCMQCYGMGDVSNLVMCSICGQHYHGSCVGLALLPGVRAGWQCAGCRVCQVCRQPEEISKVMLCEQCDKAYHPGCLRPIVTSIPKYGWKCKCCRVCTDCGSRTPGAGLSSRWHSHYTVCDSCYQQRNKGFSCPLCRKAYRAAAYREMVQCSSCKKFVHGTCDPEADPLTYQHRKETKPDYEYVCLHCKSLALCKRKDNIDDYGGDSSLTASQESLYGDGDSSEFDYPADDPLFCIGLGKGKPFCASKIAKKRLGLAGLVGRPKGVGKLGYHKRQKLNEFGRKRGPKAKMRGIFGVPGVGLQKPQSDSSKEEEPGVENRLVLCSAKDKFVLTQDICVMCGAIGTDSEGCLIACAQCGQCYHPYCANVKVTKVILQKGWRCLDCTVCEGCGERHDEGRLILCDDCDISYHIYCMDPPLDYVPHGTWKCKWCALCQTCGSNDPGFNSSWQKNYTQCGPCASHSACASCQEPYNEGDLIIQCVQCERWLHCACDHIKTEADAEKCAEEGYNCVLCRPRDVPPPHIQCNLPKPQLTKYPRTSTPPPIIRSPELYKPSTQQYLVDGVYLSEAGMHHIKSLTFEQQQTRKKRRKMLPVIDKDADIMATIESVVAGSSLDNSFEENGGKLDMDIKDEPNEVFKEGMVWTHTDQPPPEGYSLYTTENGISVLRRKRQRNLQKLGIGGFVVRLRGTRKDKEHEGEPDKPIEGSSMTLGDDKPRKKVQRKKQQPKLAESFPLYMQEAFFGKDLMDITKDRDLKSSSDSDSERNVSGNADTIQLSQDELKAIEQVKSKNAKEDEEESKIPNDTLIKREEIIDDDASDTEALGDILPISSDLLDSELVNTIMNEPDDDLAKASEALDDLDDGPGTTRDELTDILSPHFNLESMVRDTGLPNMDSKDVEEIFKGVLTDESQESQESSVFPIQAQTPRTPSTTTPLVSPSPHPTLPTGIPLGRPQVPVSLPPVAQSNLNSPMSFPPPSPYHSEYSNSPQFSPAFSEPPSPWVNPDEEGSVGAVVGAATGKQGNNVKMFQDEKLGAEATISSVLYANLNHPEWKEEFPSWPERCKQILKKWRALPNETKAPYLTQARDNRATVRMKKTQQIPKDLPSTIQVTTTSSPTIMTKPVTTITSSQITSVIGIGTGQKQIGLLASVANDKSQEKQGLQTTGQTVITGLSTGVGGTTTVTPGNHIAEVCAVQGPPRQLTTLSPSPSPTSSTSSSPRPNSVNSINYISNLSSSTTTANQDTNCTMTIKLTQSPATVTTNLLSSCTNNSDLQNNQITTIQQRNNLSNHITISTSTIVNSPSIVTQVSQSTSNITSGTIVVAGTVRQFTTVDHQIRVLTPSEIMRTLPSLSQEHYDPPPTAIIHTVPVQTPAMEQDRLSNRDRSTREAEQERQWKQLQALRQQQAALQQQVIHEQRVHAMARAHRQINDDGSPMTTDNNAGLTTQLQVTTSQDGTQLGPMTSPSPGSRATFATPPLKVNRVATPQSPLQGIPRLPNQSCTVTRPVGTVVRPGLPNTFAQPPSPFSPQAPQSPHDFPQSPAASQSQDHQFQRFENPEGFNQGNQTPRPIMPGTPTYATSPRNDVFSQPPGTPRPIFNPPTPRTSTHVYAPSRTPDPYSNQPQTPSPAPSYTSPRPESRQEVQPPEVFNQQPEVNRQLRDLLQRQQFSKKMDQIPGNWSQDGQSPTAETVQQQFDQGGHVQLSQHVQPAPNTVEGTFRHPLPPGIRPRMPIQLNVFIRNSQGNVDARVQGMDPRTRMLLQRPQVPGIPQQHFQNQPQQNPQQVLQQRMPAPRNPMADQYEMLQQAPQVPQSQPQQLQTPPQPPRFSDPQQHNQTMAQRIVRSSQDINQSVRMMTTAQQMQRPNLIPSTVNDNPPTSEASEIPDNVTAELEKLEQEGAPMGEVEGVSAILGDLAEDDDELLAEMGADFNILEYADPELDNITGGEKTNILDMDLEQVEVETKEEKLKKESKVEEHKTEDMGGATTSHEMSDTNTTVPPQVEAPNVPPPSVQVPQIATANQPQPPQQPPSAPMLSQNHPQAVVVQQQMNHHVQQAAAMGRPMPPGTRLLSPDGAVGVVTSTNTVTVSYPSTFPGHGQRVPQQHMQLQQQRLGMRVPGVQGVPGRVVSVSHMIGPRMPLAPPPPPPPPPYPGPPPPYPGPVQMGLCPGGRGMPRPPVHIGHQMPVPGPPMAPVVHKGSSTLVPHPHRRPLLLQSCSQEQPLLLEDLLEQEKREQEKQQKQQQVDTPAPGGPLLSDSDFERLRADVLGSSALGSPPQGIVSGPTAGPVIRPPGKPRPPSAPGTPWPQVVPDAVKLPVQTPRQPIATQTPPESRIATFNIPHLPAPPAPPDVIVTEQDRMIHIQYEQWLQHQAHLLKQQQTYYDTEVQKLRKARKSLNSKQRQLRKSGNELTENDAIELQRISNEQAVLQKQLDASRKQVRQHNMLAQEYQSKQQQRQAQPQTSEPCSPLMSPSQHSSPMHSPAGLVSHSPGPGSSSMIQHSPATSMIQHSPNPPLLQHSPGTQQPANPGTMSPHSMQPSPRIGTPHSQPEESPFSPGAMPSPGMCGPSATRMASPQHRAVMSSRLATSPGAFPPDGRGTQQIMTDQGVRIQNIHQRFVRPPNVGELVQRPRLQMQGGIIYNQRSPLGSPQPSQQPMLTQQQHQQLLQRQIQQQQQQQQQQHDINVINQEQNMINQRNLQLAQQRQMMSQSQQSQQHVMQKPPSSPMVSQPANSPSPQLHQQMQQNYGQPPSSPMPRSPMVQQTMGSPMLQQQLSQNSQPPSPMATRILHPPTSPMVSQYQPNPPSPMARNHPSTSPMLQHQLNNQHHPPPPPPQTPSSPMPRSPMVAGSPMQMQRRQSSGNSPALPDRPQSVENPGTPRTPHTPHYNQHSIDQQQQQQQQQQMNQNQLQENQNQMQQNQSDLQNRGGGNPHNPLNPIPFKRNFGRFGFIKLGLRGGSPMWSTKPESSKGKTEPRLSTSTVSDDKPNTSAVHRKTGISQSKINSLVCADYNDFDDDSHTPPQTPPTRVESKVLQSAVTAEKTSNLSLGSPSDKLEAMPDTTDYDDDKTIVNEEVTLSSTAQRDNDDITVIEEFAESELGDVVLGALDPDMQEEYVLFDQDMVVDLSVDSNDSLSHALVNNTNQSHDLVQILEIEQSHDDQVLSDEELLPTQTRNKKGLRLDIVRSLGTGKRLVTVTDTPESPDQEEIVDHSPVTSPFLDHTSDHNFMTLVGGSEVVIINPSTKSPEDNFSKESCCDEESQKIDCNSVDTSQKNIHEASQSIELSAPELIDKKTPSFNFADKPTLSPGDSAILTSENEPADAPEIASTISVNEIVTKPTTVSESPQGIAIKDVLTSLSIENEKQTILPSSMASIVADAKIAAKLSQTAMQTATLKQVKMNSIDVIDGPDGTSKNDGIISDTIADMTSSKNLFPSKCEETIVNSVVVKPTSVTLKPKMSVSELSIKDNEISKSKTVSIESEKSSTISKIVKEDQDDEKAKIDTNISTPMTNCNSSTSDLTEEITEEKKTDPLNTTDELESMLEAIHNPAENALNGDNKKEKSEVSSRQRISPVADELSLVNILESDTEPMMNEKKDEQKEQSEKPKENESIDFSNTSEVKAETPTSARTFEESVNESEENESPDDILDMLHNIISTKPEMANTDILEEDRSRKSSLIYQLPTPLESLPLNILQDSLMDLEVPGTENEQPPQIDEKLPTPTPVTTESQAVKKSPLQTQPLTTTIAVSTVAQLQRSTTTVPHLSPLSKPTELTSNVANVSHQLRTLLSSLHTNHSQSYTTAGQTALVTMVSSVSSGSKASIVVTAPGTNSLSSATTTLNFTKSSADTKSTFSVQLKESQSVISTLNKTTSSEQFNRISSSVGVSLASLSTTVPRPATNSGISITSNAMLNAMLSRTPSAKPSIAGHRANTILTSNLLSSVLPSPIVQKSQNLQAILQVTSSASLPSKASLNAPSTAVTSVQSGKTVVPPMISNVPNTINVTTSILQSTLSQAPTLHSQLTSGQPQYKTTGLLPIDNKSGELENLVQTTQEEETKPQIPTTRSEGETPKGINAHRMEESQNVLLKQLLQNTACATTVPPTSTPTASNLPIVPSLEAQLARPTPTPPSSLLPPLLNKLPNTKSVPPKQILNRETSFVSQPPALKTQSPPIKEEIPKASTPVSSVSVPPLHCTPRPVESIAKPQIQSKQAPPMTSQPIVPVSASKPIPVTSKIESPPQPEVPTPISTAPGPIKTPTTDPMTSSLQMRVSSIPTTFARLVSTTKPVATVATQKMIPPSPQSANNIQSSSQPSTPIATTPPHTPQPQLQVQSVQKPSTPIHIQHNLNQQQLQSPRIHVVNTLQPSVPQTMPHKLGHQAHLQQGAIAQHTVPLVEVKKEILDEVLSGSAPTQNSDTKDFLTAKEEIMDGAIDDKTDLKKLKRRQYQQKRRQSQGKDASAPPQKKRSRKVSRLDEDYDTFVDSLMIQLRQLPQMTVLEPLLGRNYGVCPIFGSGDLSKIENQKDYNTRTGDLTGVYGVARLMGVSDHYNTQPFGEQEPSSPQQPASTQRGFYDQEFPPLKLDDSLDKKENLVMTRDVDTPDTIVSSSSPECVIPEFVNRFPGLRLIEEESDEESDWLKRVSPVIPLVSPIPIRLKPVHIKDNAKQDKENVGTIRLGKSPPVALRENGNVTVTLTLNSQAADDIMGVLKDLANILNISPPNGYQIVERTTTPPSQKLGLYRTKGKDGKEGAPIDIQSILNGAAKFCRHCDVVILNSLIRKKVSDLPFLSKEEAEPGDELCFCSAACYMQFALMHRTPPTNQGKAATIVDHLCQKSDVKLIDTNLKKKLQEKRLLEKPNLGLECMDIEPLEMNRDIKIKTEKDDNERLEIHEEIMQLEEKRPKKHPASEDLSSDSIEPQPPAKLWRGVKYKFWTIGGIQPATKYKKPTDKEITEMLFRMGVTVSPAKTEDSRRCMFCQNQGDGAADGPARLLNFDVDKWVHLNCALWSEDVYETVNGALMNLDIALQHSLVLNCVVCEKPGATVKCFKIRCTNVYHLGCAVKDGCVFYKNKSTFCSQHVQKNDKDNELTTLSVYRRVYVNRDENRQVAAVMHHSDHNHLLRVGSLIFLSVGQLLPHQLANFHTPHYIYPVGYKIVRFYWSMRRPNKRCRYVCSIHDVSGRPEFRVLVQEPAQEDVELRDATPRAVWSRILQPLSELRKSTNSVQLFPRYVSGEDLFGLTEPAIVRVLESLPGIETLTDYRPKYGRNPLLELPLAINPTGSARTEARLRNQLPWKRPHTQRTGSSARATYAPAAAVAGEVACPYSKQFVHSKSSQYKKMKQDWRNNVYLARSKIQGLGLYAARDLEKHQMVIEYIGEIIRTELAETREKQYEARNRGIYMFRLDEERVVDATLCGGLARYINHSCNPNCVAEIVEVERDLRIIIFAKRRISRGEELAYDYKFDIEDDQHKIACACGAPNCRKWMN